MGWYSPPGIGMPGETRPCASVGFGSGWGAARETRNASAWVRTERDQTLRPRRPMKGAINSSHRTGAQQPEGSAPATERCPAGEGLKHSSRRTVQRAKDLNTPTRWTGPGTEGYVNSAWSGPRCLRRATSNPQRQHSLVGDPSRERIRSVRSYPGNRDRAPKISMVGNLGKAKQHGHYHSRRDRKRGLAAPPRRFSPNC